MIKEVLKSIYRQFIQKPTLSILNIIGLAGGIATFSLILIYASDQMNFDDWVENSENLYRIDGRFLTSPSGGYTWATMGPLKPALDADFPEVVISARLSLLNWPVKRGEFVNYDQISLVDEEFLELFSLDFVMGEQETAIATPSSVILSETMATKYFGEVNPIGETLTINGNLDYVVTGVFRDLPDNTDLTLDIIIQSREELASNSTSWNDIGVQTFVRLDENASIADVNEKLAVLVDQNRPFIGGAPGDMREIFMLFLQPFDDIHLGASVRTASNPMGNYAMIYGFLAVAVIVLAISAFNFVSMATARALEREREICLRKVAGAKRGQIIRYVLGESIAQTLLATIIGLGLAIEVLPIFGQMVDRSFTLSDFLQPEILAFILFGSLFLGLFSGLYPALFISNFHPARFLTGGRSQRTGLARLRSSLVFVQFVVSISFIVGSVTISQQMDHINRLDLGFDQNNLAILRGINRAETASLAEALKREIKQVPGVLSVTRTSVAPMDNSTSMEGFYSKHIERKLGPGARLVAIDYEFIETMGMTLTQGRVLDERFAEDMTILDGYADPATVPLNRNVIISEVLANALGYGESQDIIGEQIQLSLVSGGGQFLAVVGVVRGMSFASARSGINGQIYYHDPASLGIMVIRFSPGAQANAMVAIGEIWANMYPDTPIRTDFMEERVERLYQTEQQQLQLFSVFSGLAVLLSSIGLIGLVMNSVSHRIKEISLRRVMGAKVSDIIKLFTWQYSKPVLLANIPAWMIAFYYLNGWLEKYSERIDMSPGLYVLAGAAILAVTMALILTLVTRSALTSPAMALRYE